MPQPTLDTLFLPGAFRYVAAKSYDPVMLDLPLQMGDVPITAQCPEDKLEYTWRGFSINGQDAAWASDYDDTWPSVDIDGTENTRKVYELHMSYGYSERELMLAQSGGLNDLDTRRAVACRRKMEEKKNFVFLHGNTARGIPGFLNYPGISYYDVPNGAASAKDWAHKTSKEVLADLYGILNVITETTKGGESPDTLRLPRAQFNYINQTIMSTTGDATKTILQVFREANPGLDVGIWDDLGTAGAGGGSRFIAYRNDPDKVVFECPLTYDTLETWQISPDKYMVPAICRLIGTIVYYPASICYGDGI